MVRLKPRSQVFLLSVNKRGGLLANQNQNFFKSILLKMFCLGWRNERDVFSIYAR